MSTVRIRKEEHIDRVRERYPEGLHFVVGDVHGEEKTLRMLMDKIAFDPSKDHVYFIGDYNEGGNPTALLNYMAEFYQADFMEPGFHMIRGNHERELWPRYPLDNLPDIIVLRGTELNYYMVHAGMVDAAFRLINDDIAQYPEKDVFAYRLDDSCAGYDAPFRQIVWSRNGLYSQRSFRRVWPDTYDLYEHYACIIHGHTPYSFFMDRRSSYDSNYGDKNLFWEKQHIWFSEDLCSFNIDSDVKGRCQNGETYRGLACLCLEVLEDTAASGGRRLTIDTLCDAENAVFSSERVPGSYYMAQEKLDRILTAAPEMKTITLSPDGIPVIVD